MENWSRKDEWQRLEEKESGENKAYLKNDVIQPLRLEPRGAADDPVTHNSDRQSSRRQLLIFPPSLHVRVGYPDASRRGSCQPLYQARAAMKYHD